MVQIILNIPTTDDYEEVYNKTVEICKKHHIEGELTVKTIPTDEEKIKWLVKELADLWNDQWSRRPCEAYNYIEASGENNLKEGCKTCRNCYECFEKHLYGAMKK